jgi:Tn3 transposase DDE domain
VKSGDPVEQEKQLKYASLVANTIMLSNVADLTTVLADMAEDKHPVTPRLVACLSPYMQSTSVGSGNTFSIWTTCPAHWRRNRSLSRRPCDHFLHVS